MLARGRFGAIALGVLAAGCGSGTVPPPRYSLEGSLSAVMDLGWDEAVLDTTTNEIAVRFIRHRGGTEDLTLKVTWSQAGQVLNTPATIDLGEDNPANPTQQRGIVSRNVLDDPRRAFPLMVKGPTAGGPSKMSFIDQIRPDSVVRGQFNVTFVNGTGFANGRTVYGPFAAKVPP